MARIRSIKPEFRTDRKLGSVSIGAHLTFGLLITAVDDHGFILAAPRQLLGDLYPHREAVAWDGLRGWIEELVSIGAMRWRETTDGEAVLEICNWSKHQRVDNAGVSRIAPRLRALAETRGGSPRVAESRGSEVGVGVGEGSGVVDLSPEDRGNPQSRVDNRPAPLVADATRNGNSGTAPLPFHAAKLVRTLYGTAPKSRQDDVGEQLRHTLGAGARFEGKNRVQAVDVDHLDDACRRVLADPPRKRDAAIRHVLLKLRDTYGQTKASREKAAHAEPPRRRAPDSKPTPIGELVRATA